MGILRGVALGIALAVICIFSAKLFISERAYTDSLIESKNLSFKSESKHEPEPKSEPELSISAYKDENSAKSINSVIKANKVVKKVSEVFISNKDLKEIFLDKDRDKNAELSAFSKTYKKIYSFNALKNEEMNLSIKFDQGLKDIVSVVLVSKKGVITPYEFNLNQSNQKEFKEGQDLFKDDWVKLDTRSKKLNSINFKLKAKDEDGLMEVFLQKIKKGSRT